MDYREFNKWRRDYEKIYSLELKRRAGQIVPQSSNVDKELLKQYQIYKSEIRTRQLIIATWALAVFTTLSNLLLILLTHI